MKTIKKTVYAIIVCVALILTGCSKNNDDGAGAGDPSGMGSEFLTAKVNGTSFEAAQDPAVIVGATVSNGIMAFQGGKNDGETIRGTITGYNGPGTYTTGDDISNANSLTYLTLTPVASWMSTFNIGSGTVTVTSDNGTTIEGTFSFEGFNAADQSTKNISEGRFKATIE
jgi:hypothetical protein